MGDVLRSLAVVAATVAIALPAAAFDGPAQPGGGKKGAPAPTAAAAGDEQSKTAALVQQAFEGGIKAYGAGKYEDALRAFEAAVRGGLPSSQMPRLLYYRGLTFRKMGKTGFAISDLSSALWLHQGLSDAERADAIKVRAIAFSEAGVTHAPEVPQSKFPSPPPLPGPGAEPQLAAAAPSHAPAAPSPPSSSGGITGFFSNLFGGGSSSSSDPSTTASITPAPPPAAASVDSWAGATEVAPATTAANAPRRAPEIASPFVTQVAAVGDAGNDAVAHSAMAPKGKFSIQVAAVRSRSEAEALAGLLVGRHGEQLGGRQPIVDESVIGSMGTFYRVRLGPYASAAEPDQLCAALRSDGFDCLLVSQ